MVELVASDFVRQLALISRKFAKIAAALLLVSVVSSCAIYDLFGRSESNRLHQLVSQNGVLSTTLVAQHTKVELGGTILDGMTYNGDFAGPVMRVRQGDVLKVKLVNHLDQLTNLHFHGLHTTPLGYSDNVHLTVAPGQSIDYEVPIPVTQPPGLYWYHAHIHGISEGQVMGGLSGALVVEGLEARLPALQGLKENLLVFKDLTFDDSADPTVSGQWHDRVTSINGLDSLSISSRPGETQLWRIGNHSANLPVHIKLTGHKFRVISRDGAILNQIEEADVLDLNPANRVEVLVTAGQAGQYEAVATGVPTGVGPSYSLNRRLAVLTVGGDSVTIPVRPSLTEQPDMHAKSIDARREYAFTQNVDESKYYLGGRLFDAERVDLRVPLGSVEEWTIRNDTDDLHAFHIHQVHFQVVEVNGVAQPFNGYADTVRVPSRGTVKVILPFTDPAIVGRFMYHCHVLNHEDHGMMAQIEVYDPAGKVQAADWISRTICRKKPELEATWGQLLL